MSTVEDHHHLDVIKLLAAKVLDSTNSSFVIVEDDAKIIIQEAAKVVTEVIKEGSRPSSAHSRASRPTSAAMRTGSSTLSQKPVGEHAHLIANNSVRNIISEAVSRPQSASLLKASFSAATVAESSILGEPSVKSLGIADEQKEIAAPANRPTSEVALIKPVVDISSEKHSAQSSTKSVSEDVHLVAQNSVKDILSIVSSRPTSAAASTATAATSSTVHLVAQSSVKDILSSASRTASRPPSASVNTLVAAPSTVAPPAQPAPSERSKTPTELAAASLATSAVNGILAVATSRPSSALGNTSTKITSSSVSATEKPPLNPRSGSASVVASSESAVSQRQQLPPTRPASAPATGELLHSVAATSVSSILSSGASAAAAATAARRPVSAAPTASSTAVTSATPAAPRSPQGKEAVQGVQRAAKITADEVIDKATISTPNSSSNNNSRPVSASSTAARDAAAVPSKHVASITAKNSTATVMEAHLIAVTMVSDIVTKANSRPSSALAAAPSAPAVTSAPTTTAASATPSSHVRFSAMPTVLPALERKTSVDSVVDSGLNNDTLKMFENFSSHHPGSEVISGVSLDFVSAAVRRGSLIYHEKHMMKHHGKKEVNFATSTTVLEDEEDVAGMLPMDTLSELRDSDSLVSDSNSGKQQLSDKDNNTLFRSMSGLTENTLDYVEPVVSSSNSIDMFSKFSAHHPEVVSSGDAVRQSPAQMATKQNTVHNAHIDVLSTDADDLELQIYEDLSETPKMHSKHIEDGGPASGSNSSVHKPRTAPAALGTNAVKFSPFAGATAAASGAPPVVPVIQLPSDTSTTAASGSGGAAVVKPSPRIAGPTLEHISPRPIIPSVGSSSSSKLITAITAVAPRVSDSSPTVFNTLNNNPDKTGATTSISPAPSPSDSMMSDVHRFAGTSPRAPAGAVAAVGAVPGPKVDALLDALVKGSPRLTSQQAVTTIMKISPRLVNPGAPMATAANNTAVAKFSRTANAEIASTNENVNLTNNAGKPVVVVPAASVKSTTEIEAHRKKAEQERSLQLAALQAQQKKFTEQEERIREARQTKQEMEQLLAQLQRDLKLLDEKKDAKNNALLQALNLLQSQMQENNQLLMHHRK